MLFDCKSAVANNCVPLFSMELFASNNVGNFRNHSVSMDPNVFEETKVSPNTKNNIHCERIFPWDINSVDISWAD